MTATVPDLLAELGPATDFADASCIGRWRWFDPPGEREPAASVQKRHEAAVHVCGSCPEGAFARCAATVRGLPKAQRRGVWAGRSFDTTRTAARLLGALITSSPPRARARRDRPGLEVTPAQLGRGAKRLRAVALLSVVAHAQPRIKPVCGWGAWSRTQRVTA